MFVPLLLGAQQGPRIGIIDFHGRAKVPETELRKVLGVREGGYLPRSKGDVEEALEKIPNVVRARLEAVCCDDGKAVLYIGIEEKGSPHFEYNLPPLGVAINVPNEVHAEYTAFLAAVGLAVRAGETGESLHDGHSLMNNAGARAHQLKFVELAKAHLPVLRQVLKESGDEEQRAIAAYVLGYASAKTAVVDDLQAALRDPDDTVRNNAMRALGAIAVLAARDPAQSIRVSPTWFIEMLDSLIWSDRSTAAVTLVTLTERRDSEILNHIKERSLATLLEMAQWKHLPHALPGFILVGRVAGMEEEAIRQAWSAGDRASVVDAARKAATPAKRPSR